MVCLPSSSCGHSASVFKDRRQFRPRSHHWGETSRSFRQTPWRLHLKAWLRRPSTLRILSRQYKKNGCQSVKRQCQVTRLTFCSLFHDAAPSWICTRHRNRRQCSTWACPPSTRWFPSLARTRCDTRRHASTSPPAWRFWDRCVGTSAAINVCAQLQRMETVMTSETHLRWHDLTEQCKNK